MNCRALFGASAPNRESHHRRKNHYHARRRQWNSAPRFGQDGQSAVHKFDVYPINQQGCFAELYEWIEAFRYPAPAAPRKNRKSKQQQNTAPHQEKIGVTVPVIVDGVDPDAPIIPPKR